MKKLEKLIAIAPIAKWITTILAIASLAGRYFYGRENEINENSEFALSTLGVLLTISTTLFFLLTIIFWNLAKESKKE